VNELDRLGFSDRCLGQMRSAQPDGRDLLTGAPEGDKAFLRASRERNELASIYRVARVFRPEPQSFFVYLPRLLRKQVLAYRPLLLLGSEVYANYIVCPWAMLLPSNDGSRAAAARF
jgi:hypothetical protein